MLRTLALVSLLTTATVACGASKDEDKTTKQTDIEAIDKLDANTFTPPKDPDFAAILPEKVAKMGSVIITRDSVIAEIGKLSMTPMFAYAVKPKLTTKEAIKEYVVMPMLEKDVLLKLAAEAGFSSSEASTKKFFEAELEKLTASQKEEIQAQLAMQSPGMTLEKYTNMVSADPSFQEKTAIQAWIMKDIDPLLPKVDSESLKAAYEKTKDTEAQAYHILITPENATSEGRPSMDKATPEAKKAAKEKLEAVLSDIKKGADFGEMAEKFSSCPSGKSAKGGLGMNRKGAMVPAFDKETFALLPGGMSDVFETEFGYHIVRRATLDEMKPALEAIIKGDALQAKIKELVDAGMKKFDVEPLI